MEEIYAQLERIEKKLTLLLTILHSAQNRDMY